MAKNQCAVEEKTFHQLSEKLSKFQKGLPSQERAVLGTVLAAASKQIRADAKAGNSNSGYQLSDTVAVQVSSASALLAGFSVAFDTLVPGLRPGGKVSKLVLVWMDSQDLPSKTNIPTPKF